jgi:hypothetical protein
MRRPLRASTFVPALVAGAALLVGCGPGFPMMPDGDPEAPPDQGEPVKVLATGLEGPFGLAAGHGKELYVAESGAGQITRVDPRSQSAEPVVTGLLSPAGVTVAGDKLAIVTGGGEVPDVPVEGDASLLVARPGGSAKVVADLEAYELANNPDGQLQFDPETGEPLDALSNPFAVLAADHDTEGHGGHRRNAGDGGGYQAQGQGGGHGDDMWVYVADGGANVVLAVSRKGEVRTFFVPPVVTTGDCAGRPNNDPEHTGCDPVPTGLAHGPGGTLYVSTLSGEAPGQGRVYVLDARSGAVLDVIEGFDSPTGVAVARDGTVYVSEVLEGAPPGEEPPPDDFDPSTVGRIVRLAPDGSRRIAEVTMPVGLVLRKGTLYSTAWSIAGFLGIPAAGQVVAVRDRAFVP